MVMTALLATTIRLAFPVAALSQWTVSVNGACIVTVSTNLTSTSTKDANNIRLLPQQNTTDKAVLMQISIQAVPPVVALSQQIVLDLGATMMLAIMRKRIMRMSAAASIL